MKQRKRTYKGYIQVIQIQDELVNKGIFCEMSEEDLMDWMVDGDKEVICEEAFER